ncbi:hypothetical protein MKK75_11060 [Methylobacterium sp. J-030]|uniref:hypothetical protein n=1 Tax=Methylobacterium sp. J-030 TaxID=2836627 RepID=UPI001FBBCD30|nr:hypothetical protein [Methylobacterium sp. J-030]MCJ2069333.1 hypothetical protein [Methylobacterium sp. J-030]
MNELNLDISKMWADVRANLPRATYFVLQAYTEFGDHDLLASIEDAEDEGGFAIHVGLPDRPDHRYAILLRSFEAGVVALAAFRSTHPHAGLWLSTQELLAEIQGADLWRGVVEARASCDPTDTDCDWNLLAAAVATKAVTGAPITVHPSAHPVIAGLAARL